VKKKVLVAPLDWGLGHATRCIPIIRELAKENEVVLATSGLALPLLKQEFPTLTFLELPSYRARYSAWLPLMLKIFLQAPTFISAIVREHRAIKKIVKEHAIDVIISDNRYGCYSSEVKSIFITHQRTILMPKVFMALQPLFNFANQKLVARFAECWVPDFETQPLTGPLSVGKHPNTKFIGMLSRFEKSNHHIERKYDLLLLLSGPEPQRTIFERELVVQLQTFSGRALLVRGLPGAYPELPVPAGNQPLRIINHLPAQQLQQAIEESDLVLARAGYTTIMDLYFLEKKAIFVPTPGQTEQEYLARELEKRKIAFTCPQEKFSLQEALAEVENYSGFKKQDAHHTSNTALTQTIKLATE
jgi:uncharacterized protein (TIGR00661 family)